MKFGDLTPPELLNQPSELLLLVCDMEFPPLIILPSSSSNAHLPFPPFRISVAEGNLEPQLHSSLSIRGADVYYHTPFVRFRAFYGGGRQALYPLSSVPNMLF